MATLMIQMAVQFVLQRYATSQARCAYYGSGSMDTVLVSHALAVACAAMSALRLYYSLQTPCTAAYSLI